MMSIALPLTALIAFSGYTVSVMLQAEQSLIDFGISLMSRPDTAQVVIDLYLLATLGASGCTRTRASVGSRAGRWCRICC